MNYRHGFHAGNFADVFKHAFLTRALVYLMRKDAPLYLYGPYRRAGVVTAPSTEAFDESLKARNPEWGLRDLEAVTALARSAGFAEPDVTEMPANNLSVVFRRV